MAKGQDANDQPAFEIVKYYFVELITNADRAELPKAQVDSIQSAHMANINKMVEEKVLMLAGPFEGGGGIFILRMDSKEEAEARVRRDPAISAGRLNYKLRAWYTTTKSFVAEEMYKN
jgi:uncharacterized protein YciI